MENLNKLTFKTYKIKEKALNVPMEKIKQEFDTDDYVKLYLFRIFYIQKYNSKTNTFTVYMTPLSHTDTNIVKAYIPLELIYTHKVIGGYDYERGLEENEHFIIKTKMFKIADYINRGLTNWFVLGYGYLVNRYKNDDANTKLAEGIQEFAFTECSKKQIRDGSFLTYYVFNRSLLKIYKTLLLDKNPNLKPPRLTKFEKERGKVKTKEKSLLELKAQKLLSETEFKEIPEDFFIDKEYYGNNRTKK